jgi:hypothetical protein
MKQDKVYLYVLSVAFIFLLTIFYGASEYLIRNHIEPNDVIFDHLSFIENSDSEWIALGDSRPSRNLCELKFIDNWAFASETLETVEAKVHYLLSRTSPKYVILQADPHLFCYNLINYKSRHHDLVQELHNSTTFRIKSFSSYHKEKLLLYWKAKFVSDKFQSNSVLTSNGSVRELEQKYWSDLDELLKGKKAYNRFFIDQLPIKNWKESKYYKKYLEIINSLRDQGIQVLLVSYPIVEEYQHLALNNDAYLEIKSYFDHISNAEGVHYLDLSQSVSNENFFQDQDHLNTKGAMYLKEIFYEELKKLEII